MKKEEEEWIYSLNNYWLQPLATKKVWLIVKKVNCKVKVKFTGSSLVWEATVWAGFSAAGFPDPGLMEALYASCAQWVWVCVLVIDLSGFLCRSISLSIKTFSNIHPPPPSSTVSIHPSPLIPVSSLHTPPAVPPSQRTHYPSVTCCCRSFLVKQVLAAPHKDRI